MHPAKAQYNPFLKRIAGEGSGFPDLISFRREFDNGTKSIVGVECKVAKYLSPEERLKCEWLLDNKVFDVILIAFENKEGEIEYMKYQSQVEKALAEATRSFQVGLD
jgi:hypothetical protein